MKILFEKQFTKEIDEILNELKNHSYITEKCNQILKKMDDSFDRIIFNSELKEKLSKTIYSKESIPVQELNANTVAYLSVLKEQWN